MSEKLKWEKKNKLNIANTLEQVNSMAKQVIGREIGDIVGKMDALQKMGLIKDKKQINELKKKVKEINL